MDVDMGGKGDEKEKQIAPFIDDDDDVCVYVGIYGHQFEFSFLFSFHPIIIQIFFSIFLPSSSSYHGYCLIMIHIHRNMSKYDIKQIFKQKKNKTNFYIDFKQTRPTFLLFFFLIMLNKKKKMKKKFNFGSFVYLFVCLHQ